MMGVGFRLEAGLRLDLVSLLGLKWRMIRVPSLSVGWVGGRWDVAQGFRYGGLPRRHAYCMG